MTDTRIPAEQAEYNTAKNELFQLAVYGHFTHWPTGTGHPREYIAEVHAAQDRFEAAARAVGMREAAAMLRRYCPDHTPGDIDTDTAFMDCHCDAATQIEHDANDAAPPTPPDATEATNKAEPQPAAARNSVQPADTPTVSAAAISRQLAKAGFPKSASTGDGSGTCTRGFIARQDGWWRAEVCVRPQERPDLQAQTDRHEAALRSLGYTTEQYRRPYTGGPLIIRVTRPAPSTPTT